ncbi:hypothetical protein ElyMa_001178300 [Elysia marginata]|uniref:Uncharacterized protein n=1 Tax=Elysia marginata TaxID=1093978 RepID=A0AAV4I2U0_9GAST|nr:hypothetical protein ElyMa_001178300 [Elysia marginata]
MTDKKRAETAQDSWGGKCCHHDLHRDLIVTRACQTSSSPPSLRDKPTGSPLILRHKRSGYSLSPTSCLSRTTMTIHHRNCTVHTIPEKCVDPDFSKRRHSYGWAAGSRTLLLVAVMLVLLGLLGSCDARRGSARSRGERTILLFSVLFYIQWNPQRVNIFKKYSC